MYQEVMETNIVCIFNIYSYGNIRTHFTLQYNRVFYLIVSGIHQLVTYVACVKENAPIGNALIIVITEKSIAIEATPIDLHQESMLNYMQPFP